MYFEQNRGGRFYPSQFHGVDKGIKPPRRHGLVTTMSHEDAAVVARADRGRRDRITRLQNSSFVGGRVGDGAHLRVRQQEGVVREVEVRTVAGKGRVVDDGALRPVAAALDLLVPLEAAQRADARAVRSGFFAVPLLESSRARLIVRRLA